MATSMLLRRKISSKALYKNWSYNRTPKRTMTQYRKCYGDCLPVHPSNGEISILVRHAHRVKQLIHAELTEQEMSLTQYPEYAICHKAHEEWFDVEERHVIAVIGKWSAWITSEPYEKVPCIPKPQKKSNNRRTPSKGERGRKAKSPNAKTKSPEPDTPEDVPKNDGV